MQSKAPYVSLLMCTLGRHEQLIRLIGSLEAQTCTDFELVIVDQNPTGFLDHVVARANQKLTVKYCRSKPGLSRARNVGLQHCAGVIVAFPDDDCWYPESLIACVIEIFEKHPELGIATGRTTDSTGKESNGRFLRRSCEVNRVNVWFCGSSNSIFAKRHIVELAGRFDESLGVGSGTPFGSGEETDLILRALFRGARVTFFHHLVVHHDQTDQHMDDKSFARAASYARGFGRVLRLHRYPVPYMTFRVSRNVAAMVMALMTFNAGFAKFKWIWATGTIAGYLSRTVLIE